MEGMWCMRWNLSHQESNTWNIRSSFSCFKVGYEPEIICLCSQRCPVFFAGPLSHCQGKNPPNWFDNPLRISALKNPNDFLSGNQTRGNFLGGDCFTSIFRDAIFQLNSMLAERTLMLRSGIPCQKYQRCRMRSTKSTVFPWLVYLPMFFHRWLGGVGCKYGAVVLKIWWRNWTKHIVRVWRFILITNVYGLTNAVGWLGHDFSSRRLGLTTKQHLNVWKSPQKWPIDTVS